MARSGCAIVSRHRHPTSSLGLWKKLDRIRRNPGVAVDLPRSRPWLHRPPRLRRSSRAERRSGSPTGPGSSRSRRSGTGSCVPRKGGLVGRALDVVLLAAGGDLGGCRAGGGVSGQRGEGRAGRTGSARPVPAPPQSEPTKGTGPRVQTAKAGGGRRAASAHAARLARGRRPARGGSGRGRGRRSRPAIRLQVPAGSVPAGGRRAGLTAHRFWREWSGRSSASTPAGSPPTAMARRTMRRHTRAGYRMPRVKPRLPPRVRVVGAADQRRPQGGPARLEHRRRPDHRSGCAQRLRRYRRGATRRLGRLRGEHPAHAADRRGGEHRRRRSSAAGRASRSASPASPPAVADPAPARRPG